MIVKIKHEPSKLRHLSPTYPGEMLPNEMDSLVFFNTVLQRDPRGLGPTLALILDTMVFNGWVCKEDLNELYEPIGITVEEIKDEDEI